MMNRIIIFFFLLLHCSLTYGQDYVYSVTTGTAWAREIFPREEKIQFRDNAMQPTLEDAPAFYRIFHDLEKNYKFYHQYNDSVFIPSPHPEWVKMFQRRAIEYSRIYTTNSQRLSAINEYFSREDVPDAAYDSLFFWVRHLYHRNVNDVFLYDEIIRYLLPHYEATQDIEHLVFCYSCAGLSNFQMSRMGDKTAEMRSELFFRKVLNLSANFSSFADPLNRYYFIASYINLVVLHTQADNIPLAESMSIARQMQQLYESPEVQQLMQKDSLLNSFAEWSIDLFNLRAIITYISKGHQQKNQLQTLYDNYCRVREKFGHDLVNTKNRYYAKLNYDDLMIEAYMKHLTWNEAFEQMRLLVEQDKDFQLDNEGHPKIKINYLKNLSESLITTLEHTSLSDEQKGRYIKDWINRNLGVISRYPHSIYTYEKGMILEKTARSPFILSHMNSEERRDLLYRLIVLEQPTTYVHSSMVANLSKVLAQGMIQAHPEYFVGIPGYSSVADVIANQDSLVSFVYQAAIHHDLGKISMPTVVNNCFRRLTDHEFDLLKLHPAKSVPFLHIDNSLSDYEDVAIGHHKSYDGEGYPAEFSNRKSPYYPIICLVTLCDCMDAATENVGRNYHTPKSFEKVLQEFDADKGTRYHPQLVEFIHENANVYAQMKAIVKDGRWDEYYKLYMNYFRY